MPRVRYRLDYLEPTNQDKNELLSSTKLAEIVCHLLLWDKGLLYATSLCSHDYLRVDRKALLGRPNDIQRRNFSDYNLDETHSNVSRFATYELSFDSKALEDAENADLDINQ